jgi:hypothetical protein
MKYTFSVTVAESKGTCHITVKDSDSEFRVYSGRNTLARTVAGVVHKFWLKHKEKEAAQEKGSGAISVQQTATRLKPGALMENGMHQVIGPNGGTI